MGQADIVVVVQAGARPAVVVVASVISSRMPRAVKRGTGVDLDRRSLRLPGEGVVVRARERAGGLTRSGEEERRRSE